MGTCGLSAEGSPFWGHLTGTPTGAILTLAKGTRWGGPVWTSLARSTPIPGTGQPSSSVTLGRGAGAVLTLPSNRLLGHPALPGKPLGSEAGPPPPAPPAPLLWDL